MTERYCWTMEVGNAAMIQVMPSMSERSSVVRIVESISSDAFMYLELSFHSVGTSLGSFCFKTKQLLLASFSVLVDGPDNFDGEGGVDNSHKDGGGEHGDHCIDGEEAGNHSTPIVSPQIHLPIGIGIHVTKCI